MKTLLPVFIGISFVFIIVQKTQAIEFIIQEATPSGNIINITAAIAGAGNQSCPNQTCYLFAALKQKNGNYFGETLNNQGEWIAYSSKPEKEFIKSAYFMITLTDDAWRGNLQARFDTNDTNYKGPGEYILTLMRFTGNSQSPAGDSPKKNLSLSELRPSPSPSLSPVVSPSPNQTTSSSVSDPSPLASPEPSGGGGSPTPSPTPQPSKIYHIKDITLLSFSPEPTVLGTQSSQTQKQTKADWQLICLLLASGTGLLLVTTFIIIKSWQKN